MNGVSNTSSFSSTPMNFTSDKSAPIRALVGLFFAGMAVGLAISLAAVLTWKFSLRRKQCLRPEDSRTELARNHSRRLNSGADGSPIQPSQKYDHICLGNESGGVELETYESLHANVHLQQSLPVYQDIESTVSHVKPFLGKTHPNGFPEESKSVQHIELHTSTSNVTYKVEPLKEQVYPECTRMCKIERQDGEGKQDIYDQEAPNTYFILEKFNERESCTVNDGTFLKNCTHLPDLFSGSAKPVSIKLDLQNPVLQQSETNENPEEQAYFILEEQENRGIVSKMDTCNKESVNTIISDNEDNKCGRYEGEDLPEHPQDQAMDSLGYENNTIFPRKVDFGAKVEKGGMKTTMPSHNTGQNNLDITDSEVINTDEAVIEYNDVHQGRAEYNDAKSKSDPNHETTKPKYQPRKRKPTYTNIISLGNIGLKRDFEQYSNIEWIADTNTNNMDTDTDPSRSPTYQNVHK